MSLRLELLLTADGRIAKAEVQKVREETDKVRQATEKAGNATAAYGQKASAARTATTALGQSNRLAAGQVGNLTSQFNDIGVMLAAGQSPLQLAIQQGTQITQVIGPLGATGAVRALGSALLGMINPVSLITIGSIAAGAAMVNWLTQAGDEAVPLTDRIEELTGSVEEYTSALETARTPMAAVRREFGAQAGEVKEIYQALSDLARLDALSALEDTTKAINTEMDALRDRMVTISEIQISNAVSAESDEMSAVLGQLREEYQLTQEQIEKADAVNIGQGSNRVTTQLQSLSEAFDITEAQARSLIDGLDALSAADGPEASAEAMVNLRDVIKGIEAEAGTIPEPLREMAKAVINGELAARRLMAAMSENSASAEEMLAKLQAEGELRQAITRYGEESALVAQLRVEAEREAFEELLASTNASDQMKDALREAWDAANGLAATDIASGISAAASEARRMADEIMNALAAAQTLSASAASSLANAEIRLEYADDPIEMARQLGRERMRETQGVRRDGAEGGELAALEAEVFAYGETMAKIAQADQQRMEIMRSSRGSSGGGRAASTRSESDALDRLIEREREQLEILRETDPVQKEMLRNREALAGATEAEREMVEQLIGARIREGEQTAQLEERQTLWRDTTYSALEGMILRSESLSDALENVIDMIGQAVLKGALLGEGPLAGIFGGGDGGLIGSIFGGAFATGGLVHGPGTGTSDDVLIAASSGEYVVNAAATKKNRQLLELINAGATPPAFARGGAIGGAASSSGGGAAPGGGAAMAVNIDMRGARGNTEIEEAARRGMEAALKEYSRNDLPRLVPSMVSNPRRIG